MLWLPRVWLAVALGAGLPWQIAIAQPQPAQTQTPNESVLPRDVKPNPAKVIDERVLPGRSTQAGGNAQKVPDERELAFANKVAQEVQGSEQRPWLRLTFPGHTGRIQAADMNPSGTWMVSAGEDKDLHVWQRQAAPGSVWFHRRTVRWEIERGDRGRIQTVAQRETLAAFAGLGARSGNGSIWIVDLTTGAHVATLNDLNQGHRQPVIALAWAPGDKLRLASADMDGRVLVWEPDPATGLWQSKVIDASDQERYGAEVATRLMDYRTYLPLRFLNERRLLLPQLAEGERGQGELRWHLKQFDVVSDETKLFVQVDHEAMVYQLAVSDDGRHWVSVDDFGKAHAWHVTAEETRVQEIPLEGAFPTAVSMSGSAARCLIATNSQETDHVAELSEWDFASLPDIPKRMRKTKLNGAPIRCLQDEAHQEVVLAYDNQLYVFPWGESLSDPLVVKQVLAPKVKPILKVAFAKEGESYRVAFGTTAKDGVPELNNVFDFSQMQLGREAVLNPQQWMEAKEQLDPWKSNRRRPREWNRIGSFAGTHVVLDYP